MPEESSKEIPLLKGVENYLSWSLRRMDLLGDSNLEDYPTGKLPKPENTPSTWIANDKKALSAMRRRVSDPILTHIHNCKTSAEAWMKLKKRFWARGIAACLSAQKLLYTARHEEGTSVAEYINRMVRY